MNIINKSRKIISINGEALLPGATMRLEDGMEEHPSILSYLKNGMVVDASKNTEGAAGGISDFERARIAEEAVAKYKAEQDAAARAAEEYAKAERESEIKAVKSMKKDELLVKAAGLGIDVEDDIKVDELKERIIAAINR